MAKFVVTALMVTLWLSGCAPMGSAKPEPAATAAAQARRNAALPLRPGPRRSRVRFSDDSAVLDAGQRGSEVLLRDAGGATPQQTVYSNARMRAEFGLGASGREAMLRYASPPLVAHCVQE